jgi:dihydroorotate dehydrogenase
LKIGGGGIYEMEQVEQVLAAGALAVQVDVAFWRGGVDWTLELWENKQENERE